MSYKPLGEIMVITKKPNGSMSRKRQLDSASILSCENRLTRMLLFGRTQALPQLEPNKYSLARKLQASVQVCRPPSRGLRQPGTPPRFRTERFVRESSRQLLLFSVIGRSAMGVSSAASFLRRLRHCPNSYASQVLIGLQ